MNSRAGKRQETCSLVDKYFVSGGIGPLAARYASVRFFLGRKVARWRPTGAQHTRDMPFARGINLAAHDQTGACEPEWLFFEESYENRVSTRSIGPRAAASH